MEAPKPSPTSTISIPLLLHFTLDADFPLIDHDDEVLFWKRLPRGSHTLLETQWIPRGKHGLGIGIYGYIYIYIHTYLPTLRYLARPQPATVLGLDMIDTHEWTEFGHGQHGCGTKAPHLQWIRVWRSHKSGWVLRKRTFHETSSSCCLHPPTKGEESNYVAVAKGIITFFSSGCVCVWGGQVQWGQHLASHMLAKTQLYLNIVFVSLRQWDGGWLTVVVDSKDDDGHELIFVVYASPPG